jgi:GLPGLI family protein
MKLTFLLACCFSLSAASAQPTLVKQAIISTTTNVIAPEEEDIQSLQNPQGPGGMNFRNMMDGETKFTTYLKDGMVKTVIKNEMGRSTIYRDQDKKLTTTLIEMMGNKMGFYITDEEQVEMKRKMDSTFKARRSKDTTAVQAVPQTEIPAEISPAGESKKIAGYNCTKAYLIHTRLLGIKDTINIWYTTEIKIQNILSTGGLQAFGGMMGNMGVNLNGLDKIEGFVMRYEANMRNRRRMEVEVTKIDLTKNIDDKEFTIPIDVEVKPMKEMQNMFGSQFRRGN